MIKRIRQLFNSKGMTLIELIVSVMVLSVIMIAVTTVFAPILRTFERANNLAEANTLLDNLSALIMDDVAGATGITGGSGTFSIKTTHEIRYYTNTAGILYRSAPGFDGPVLHKDFYKYRGTAGDETVFSVSAACTYLEGLVTITLTLTATDGWSLTRDYTARPVGLA